MNIKKIFYIVQKLLFDKEKRFDYLTRLGLTRWMSDERYLKKKYKIVIGKGLDLDHPQTFNEKLQWLKIHDRKSAYTIMVDKYAVKKYVSDKIGEEYLIPILGVWDRVEDIDFDSLPNQFVLKCTHDSGGLVICHNKKEFDYKDAKKKMKKCIRRNYYYTDREWPYKDVPRRIIAEKYMEEESGNGLTDYKFMCFGGKVMCSFTCTERFSSDGLKVTFFDRDWNVLPFERHYPKSICEIPKPENYDEMVSLAERLSESIPFVRVDFYEVNHAVYFGELTFYPGSGFEEFTPDSADRMLGEWIKLPESVGGGYWIETGEFCLWLHTGKYSGEKPDGGIGIPAKREGVLKDYKFYCFNGEPAYCQVIANRFTNETIDFFDMEWVHQEFTGLSEPHKPFAPSPIPIPITFGLMKKSAKKLADGIPFVRIDFYEVGGKMYFGEITFYPASGFGTFEPDKWNSALGSMIDLK